MKLLFSSGWLRKRIESQPDDMDEPQAGYDPLEAMMTGKTMTQDEVIELAITEALWNTSRTSWDIEAFKAKLAEYGYEVAKLKVTP